MDKNLTDAVRIYVSGLPSGIYFARFTIPGTSDVTTFKFVVLH